MDDDFSYDGGEEHGELLKKFSRWDREIDAHQGEWRSSCRLWFGMVSGDQWSTDDTAALVEDNRTPVVFNRTEPLVDAVMGAHANAPDTTLFYAKEPGDAAPAEIISAAIETDRDACDASDEEAEAARDALICGMGWVELSLEDDDDEAGSIVWRHTDVFEMGYDANARGQNLRDARYIRRHRSMDREEYREFIAEAGEDPDAFMDAERDHPDSDTVSERHRPGEAYEDEERRSGREKLYLVTEYQWVTREPSRYSVVNPMTGQSELVDADGLDAINERLGELGQDEISGKPVAYRKVFRRAFRGDRRLIGEPHVLPTRQFTYQAITGKLDKKRGTFYGVVKATVDPNMFANKLFTQILSIIDDTAKSGYFLEEGAVDDIREFEESVAEAGTNVVLLPGALSEGRLREKASMNWPAGYDRLMQFTWESFPLVTGLNMNLLGFSQDSGESGVLDQQRTRQAYGVIAWFFRSTRRYRKRSGRLCLDLLTLIDPSKLVRIVEDGMRRYVPLAISSEVHKYDIVVDEGVDSPDAKRRVMAYVMQAMPVLLKSNLPPQMMAEIVRYSDLPTPLKSKITELLTQAPDPQVAQRQQEAQQLQMRAAMADIGEKEASAQLDAARAGEVQADTVLKQRKAAFGF